MDTKERIELSKLIKEYDAEDNTSKIRKLKHSDRIRADVATIEHLKKQYSRIYKSNFNQFKAIASKRASFIFNNYTNIFNKLVKNELNLNILWQFLEVLRNIETGNLDQHEGSYKVGVLLKKLYIDSVLQKDAKNIQKEKTRKSKKVKPRYKKISWADFKNKTNNDNES